MITEITFSTKDGYVISSGNAAIKLGKDLSPDQKAMVKSLQRRLRNGRIDNKQRAA